MSRSYRAVLRHGLRRGLPSKAGFSRRQALRLGAGAAVAAALGSISGCRATPKLGARGDGPRIAVVGAGFAGLACAYTLDRAGASVVVLEAESRPGGRVLTNRSFIPGHSVELGGEFIGTNHPTWIAFAKRFKLELEEADEYEGDEPIILDGRLIRGEAADALYEQIDGALAKVIELAQPINPLRPWLSPGAAELDRQNFFDFVQSQELGDDARRLMIAAEEADNGVEAQKMSLLAYLSMVAGGGFQDYFESSETHRLKNGNDALATALAKALEGRIRFDTPVVSIVRGRESAKVMLARGGNVECDVVVLAVAPSVWDRIAFSPSLPKGLAPQMGNNVKLILSINKPFWKDLGLTPEATSDGLANLSWVSADDGDDGPSALTLFSGATDSQRLRQLDPDSRARQAIASMAPAYPNLSDVTTSDRFVDWPSIPRVRASYSFPAPGQVSTFGPTLVDGLTDDLAPLRFAGEHTSYAFIGYMEGALSSGVRVAESLVRQRAAAAVD